jgi:hypothetical protein
MRAAFRDEERGTGNWTGRAISWSGIRCLWHLPNCQVHRAMKSKAELDRLILGIAAKFCGVPERKLSADSRINLDLGVDGADADDLIETITRELGWPLENFNYDDYFGPEVGYVPILSWLKNRKNKLRPLTISMLAQMYFDCQPRWMSASVLALLLGAATQTTQFGYDNNSNLVSLTDPLKIKGGSGKGLYRLSSRRLEGCDTATALPVPLSVAKCEKKKLNP